MPKPARRLPALSLLLLLAACGGGGGGSSTASLQGTLTVPQLGAGRTLHDGQLDDIAHQARPAGKVGAGERVVLRGRVGGDDRLDVFRIAAGPGRIALTVPAAVRVEVFDARAVQPLLALGPGGQGHVQQGASRELDVAVAAAGGEVDYEVVVAGEHDAGGGVHAPAPPEPLAADSLLPAYLGADHEMVAGEVIVQFAAEGELPAATAGALAGLGLEPAGRVPGPLQKYRLAAPLAGSPELATCIAAQRAGALPGVRAASANYVYRALQNNPNDPLLTRQWHYTQIKAQQAWALFAGPPGSTSVIVAVVDTGIVLAHPDFQGRLIAGFDMISDPARALDGDGIDANPNDPGDNVGSGLPSTFHGTHVGGTVGATTNNGLGGAGMDWSCRLMPMRVLGKNGGTLEDIAQGIRFASGLANASGTVPPQRCQVMNMSLGAAVSAAVLETACNDANNAGVLLVAAAGNDNSSTPNFPASYPVCLSVGAVRFDKQRAPYSNFATTIDVWAPGGDTSVDQTGDGDPDGVLSCLAAHQGNQLEVGFGYLQGTSMAAPHVAGLAALVQARNLTLTNAQIRAFIEGNTEAISVGNGRLVDAFAACVAAGSPPINPILRAAQTNIALSATTTTAQIALSNVGNTGNTLLLQQGSVTIAHQTGTWLTATLAGGAGTGISHTRLDLAANPAGLGNGRHQATVTITPQNANVVQILVTLSIGTTGGGSEEVFVVVADSISFQNRGQAQTNAAANYVYNIGGVAVGNYLLVAGTDRDGDDIIGDEGELFGIWPSNDSPQVLVVDRPTSLTGLDFTLQLLQVQQGTTPPRLPPIRLR